MKDMMGRERGELGSVPFVTWDSLIMWAVILILIVLIGADV